MPDPVAARLVRLEREVLGRPPAPVNPLATAGEINRWLGYAERAAGRRPRPGTLQRSDKVRAMPGG